jgi:hypothetical protein
MRPILKRIIFSLSFSWGMIIGLSSLQGGELLSSITFLPFQEECSPGEVESFFTPSSPVFSLEKKMEEESIFLMEKGLKQFFGFFQGEDQEGEINLLNQEKGIKNLMKSAILGCGAARCLIAVIHHKPREEPLQDFYFLNWLRNGFASCCEKAFAGDPYALVALGFVCSSGLLGVRDFATQAYYYQLAVEKGNGLASYQLGLLYEKGWGVPQNSLKAFSLYKKALEEGWYDYKQRFHPVSQVLVDALCEEGRYREALFLYGESACQEKGDAAYKRGEMWEKEGNIQEAYPLYIQAHNLGNEKALIQLKKLTVSLNQENKPRPIKKRKRDSEVSPPSSPLNFI